MDYFSTHLISLLPGAVRALLAHLAAPAVAPLDWSQPPAVFQAGIFAWVVTAIEVVAEALGVAAGAIGAQLEVVVGYLLSAVGWIAGRLKNFIISTGSVFAKSWEGLRGLWGDVVRPALQHLYTWVHDLRAWLLKKFGPVLQFLHRVRSYLDEIYRRFLRPVFDTIDTIRGLLKVLEALHIKWAFALDSYLAGLEQRLQSAFDDVRGSLNKLINAFYDVVSLDGLFNRVPFLATLKRDAPHWIAMWWNAQMNPLSPADRAAASARYTHAVDPAKLSNDLAEAWTYGTGDLAPTISELVPLYFASSTNQVP